MEITNNKPPGQQVQTQASSAGKAENSAGQEGTSVAIKAAPKVPEFEKMDLDKAISELQEFVDSLGRSLSFRRDDSIDRSIITVRDTQTNQVVRQIPSEEIVAISRQIKQDMADMRAGLLMDKNV